MPCFLKTSFLRGVITWSYTKILWKQQNFWCSICWLCCNEQKTETTFSKLPAVWCLYVLMVFSSKVLLQYCFSWKEQIGYLLSVQSAAFQLIISAYNNLSTVKDFFRVLYDLPVCSLESEIFIARKQRPLESKVSNGMLKEQEHACKREYGGELIMDL